MNQHPTSFGDKGLGPDLIVVSTLCYQEILDPISEEITRRNSVYKVYDIRGVPVVTSTYGAPRIHDTLIRAGEEGVKKVWFLGFCQAIDGCYAPGSLLLPETVYGRDELSNYNSNRKFGPDKELTEELKQLFDPIPVNNVSVPTVEEWPESVADGVEQLEAETLELKLASALQASNKANINLGAVLVVLDPAGDMSEEQATDKTQSRLRNCLLTVVDHLQ